MTIYDFADKMQKMFLCFLVSMFNFVEGFAVQVADKMRKGVERLTEAQSNSQTKKQ